MSFPNQTSLTGTIQQLKEIVTGIQGEDHESAQLVNQMEALIVEIERKSKQSGSIKQSHPLAGVSMVTAATAAV